MMFKTYTIPQAIETLEACMELLSGIIDKGNEPFDKDDTNVLDQSLSTTFILMNDLEVEAAAESVALGKAHIKFQEQKIENRMGNYKSPNHKYSFAEAMGYINEIISLLKGHQIEE